MIYYWETSKSEIQSIVTNKINNCATIRDPFREDGRNAKYLVLGSGFDIETSRIETPEFTTAYCYHWQMSFGRITVGGRSLETMADFFRFIIGIIYKIPFVYINTIIYLLVIIIYIIIIIIMVKLISIK